MQPRLRESLMLLAGLLSLCCARPRESAPPLSPEEVKIGRHGAWTSLPAPSEPLNLILITLDTTRGDHLSCYGFPRPTTPRCDQLAADGVLFETATSPVPVTLPAHATILTGLYPYEHGVRNNGTYILPDRFQTLAETLKGRGYETGAILGAFPVDHRFGLSQGFDHYDDAFPPGSRSRESDMAQRPAAEVTRLGLGWLGPWIARADGGSEDQSAGGTSGGGTSTGEAPAPGSDAAHPFFLWLHYFDPHTPYAPPEPYASRFWGDPYSGEIASMDAAIGALADSLESAGLLEKTVLLIVGDHGESLGEHKEKTHSYFVYGATQRVPLILRLPKAPPFLDPIWHGKRVPDLVSQVDCLPTALNALGVEEQARPVCAGISLLPVIEGKVPGHAWVYMESLVPRLEYSISDLRALRTPRWKYIRVPRPELYDLIRDPRELDNLASREKKLLAAMDRDLATVLRLDIGDEAGQVAMDRETIEKLRSLGYMAGAATPRHEGPLPDPKDGIVPFERIDTARTLVADHKTSDALALIDSVLAEQPDNDTALRIRASCLLDLGRAQEAAAAYDSILAACRGCPDQIEMLMRRAAASLAGGDAEDASERVRALMETHPREPGIHLLLGRILSVQGQAEQARRAVEEEIRLFPEDPSARVFLGDLELSAGNRKQAEAAYRAALAINPNMADALSRLGELLVETGREAAGRGYVEEALRADPVHPDALFRKAWLLSREGRAKEAIPYYEKALEQRPNDLKILYNLGNLYMQTDEPARAIEVYRRADDAGLVSQELLVNLGVLYARAGNVPRAIREWKRAIELDPGNPQVPSIRQNIARAEGILKSGQGGGGR